MMMQPDHMPGGYSNGGLQMQVLTWDPRWAYPEGNMQVQTEYPYYEPGQTVQGKVFIQLTGPVMAESIDLEIKGKEKCKFQHKWIDRHPIPKHDP